MNTRLFALFGAALLAGVAIGPAMAAAQTETAGNDEANEDDAFGQQVSSLVDDLQNSTNGTGIGHTVSTFVVANNPGNAPIFAGSPGGPNATENDSQGPPAFVQSLVGNADDNETADNASVDDRRGPPEHAGGPNAGNQTAADGNVTDGDANQSAGPGNGQGPPDHAGGDDDDRDEEEDDDDGDDDRGNNGGNGGNGQGPPDDAGPR